MRTAASTCVSMFWGVFGLRGLWVLCGLWGCALVSACTASGEDVSPPEDQLLFPSGLVVSPKDSVLFAANANSELRYDSGTISVIDLTVVESVIQKWAPFPAMGPPDRGDCEPDPDHRETLVCDLAKDAVKNLKLLKIGSGVRIGNFATDIALQDFGDKRRVIVPTRGDPSIAWADYVDGKLSCTTGSTGFTLCDDAHRLTTVQNDPNLAPIPNEPFDVFADPGPPGLNKGFAVVTHLTSGAVTLVDSPADGDARIADVQFNLFATDVATGFSSATGVAGRTPGVDGDIVYVGSRTENRIQTFTVGRPVNNAPPYLIPSNFFFLRSVGNNSNGGSSDTRSIKFSQDGNRMYVVNRLPPSLQIFDTSSSDPSDPSGLPRNVGVGASDICRQASTVTVAGEGDDERAYVTCFQDGQVYVVDPRGTSQVEDIITVGRGPYAVAATAMMPRRLLFVSNFLEDTIAVVDVTPASPTRNRVVLRIGKPRAP